MYDNACHLLQWILNRYPHRGRRWTFLIDRKHQDNHTSCSVAFNMDLYPVLKTVNSQLSEQTSRSLRKLATNLAYYESANYLKVLEMFFVTRNLKIKKIM